MRKKLTKLMAVALALVMVAALLPAAAFAAGGSATEAGNLEALQQALKGEATEIKLTGDLTDLTYGANYAPPIVIDRDVTLDLNGHSMSGSFAIIRVDGANVTLVNTNETASKITTTFANTIQVMSHGTNMDPKYSAASLTISAKAGDIEISNGAHSTSSGVINLTGQQANGKKYVASLTIGVEGDTGKIKVTAKEKDSSTPGMAFKGSTLGTLTINKGEITGKIDSSWLQNDQGVTVGGVINGGTFDPKPTETLLADGLSFVEKNGKYEVIEGSEDAEAEVTGRNGRKTRGALKDLVAQNPGMEITVLKDNLTLDISGYGNKVPNNYGDFNTIKLKLNSGLTKFTITGTNPKSCKVIISGVTSSVTITATAVTVDTENGYKIENPVNANGTYTYQISKGPSKETVQVDYADGTTLYFTSEELYGAKLTGATKITLLADVTLVHEVDVVNDKGQGQFEITGKENAPFSLVMPEGDVILDLAGHNLNYGKAPEGQEKVNFAGASAAIICQRGGTLTITGKGTINAQNARMALALGASETTVAQPNGQGGTKFVTVPDYTTTGSAVIDKGVTVNGTVGIFNEGSSLEVSGTIDGGDGIAISGNGTQDANTGDNHGGTSVVIKKGGKVISSGSAAVYQPQDGDLTVEGGEITGAAGIVALDGSVDVTGGTIEATGQSDVTLPCGAVPASGIVAENNQSYGDAEKAPSVSVSGSTTTVKSATAESVTYRDTTENEVEPDITVSGGTFKTGEKPDQTVNTYVDPGMVVDEKSGEVETFSAKIVDFGYEESAKAAVEKARKSNEDLVATDWIDQTMWVTFKEPLPAGKKVELTLTFNGGKDNGEKDLVMTCVGDGEHKTFAWSFLNKAQTEGVKAKAGTYAVSAEGVTGGTPVKIEKIPDNAVKFAPTTNGSKDYANDGMTVTVKEDDKVGQYYEVRFDTEKLSETTGSGGAGKAYWLGWALVAPNGAEKYAMTKAARAEVLTIPAVANGTVTATTTVLEKNVDGKNGEGLALYYKANDTSKDSAAWVAVTWTDASGKPMGTTFIHVVFGNITYKADVEINAVEGGSGFKADKAEAEKEIKAGLDKISSTATVPTDVIKNTLWAIFQHDKVQETAVNYTYRVRKDGDSTVLAESSENVTVKNSVLLYFSLDDQLKGASPKGGKYVIELLKDNLPVANAEVEVFEVTYKADKNVTGKDVTIYTDRAGLEAALADHPDGFEFTNGASMWDKSVSSNEKDPYTYEVKLNAYTYVAPPMPGTNPDNPDNPDNPPVVDPAKQFVDVPDVPANKWYRDALNYVLTTKPGVIEGTDGTHFSPNANLTRAAFAKILWALDGKETATAANPFTDVKAGAWYYDAVIWANAEGIMLGDAGRCKPEDNITREEMAVMIQRWLNGKAATTESKFTDAKDIHDWAAGAVNWAAEQGYIKGKDNGSFAPLATLTRAEMIVVVARTQGWIG